jgi:hypothetical protein
LIALFGNSNLDRWRNLAEGIDNPSDLDGQAQADS